MPSRPVLIGRGLVPQTLNKSCKATQHHRVVEYVRVHEPVPAPLGEEALDHTIHQQNNGLEHTTRDTTGMSVDRKSYGGHSERETPGPIPNPEVKPFSADGTATERLWESRTPPDILSSRATRKGGPTVAFQTFRLDRQLRTGAASDTASPQLVRCGRPHCRRQQDWLVVGGDVRCRTEDEGAGRGRSAVNEVRLVGRVSQTTGGA